MEKIIKVYNKYKHLDRLLSDARWLNDDIMQGQILYDLWQAIRSEGKTNDKTNNNLENNL